MRPLLGLDEVIPYRGARRIDLNLVNTSDNLRDKPGGQRISGDRWSRSLLTISPEGVTLPVTVIPGNSVAALVAVAATAANKP